ncbi:MAG: 50S ribosomal protein L23 [Thermoleophilia bacterium]|nr:50S ribosomal protein L23 [Thermoleophilia bacterium]
MDARQVIIRPIISEKSYQAVENNRYSFEVNQRATKPHIRAAVEEIFKVKVIGVQTINVKPKPKRRGAHAGHTRRWKKAVVELAPGNRIEFFGAT